jgi:O-antigen ligase
MSLTAIAFLGAFIAVMGLALVRSPIYGLYGYVALFYLNPPSRWWGAELPDLRWALLAGIVTVVAALRLPPDPSRSSWLSETPAKLLCAFSLWLWVQQFWALLPEFHLFLATLYLKYAVLFFLIYRLVDSPQRLIGFLLVHFGGCVYLGWLAFNARFYGRLEGVGGPGIDEANALGMQMVTGILIGAMLILHFNGWRRLLMVCGMPLLLNTLVLTQSRSSFLALLAGSLVLWYLKPAMHRRLFYVFGALGLVLAASLAHETFWTRIHTVVEAAESIENVDHSAESRIVLFEAQLQMAHSHPLGAGHRGTLALSTRYLADEYLTYLREEGGARGRSSHSTIMSILVEHGIPGMVIYLGFGLWYLRSVVRLRKMSAEPTATATSTFGAGLAAALAAVVVAGIFVDYVRAEVQIWCAALLAVILSNWYAQRSAGALPAASHPARRNLQRSTAVSAR